MASTAGCSAALLPPVLLSGSASPVLDVGRVLPVAALVGAMDLGGGPSGVAMSCSRQASSRVALVVGLVLSGGATAAAAAWRSSSSSNLVRVSLYGSLSSTGLVEGGGCSLTSNMVGVGGLLGIRGNPRTAGLASGGDAFGRRSSSLEAWLRSPVYTPAYLPGESPKSYGLGDVDVLHAVSLLEACPCLDGFEPNNKQDWTANRFSQGCHRMEALRCGQGDGFLNLSTMKVPDKFLYVKNRSFNECIAECTSNCSCTAYAYANMSTKAINGDETRCLLWMGDLIDTEKLIGQGENLYIRLNGLSDKKWSGNVLKIALPVVSSLLIIICVCLVWICKSGGKRRNKEIWKKMMSGTSNTAAELRDGNLKYPFISFREIVLATNNFSNSNMIGHGGFGNVYKGILGDEEIAVKRLSKGSGQGALEFRNEVILIAKLQHQNLVRLLGFCIHGDEKLLIYEYLTNKSLDAFLFDATRKSIFGWPIRFEIIKGVARGLLYLHQDSRLKIIHRDLKASNILLDAEMSPKISDFGMARIFGVNQQQGNTNRVVGTYGYMSPEYALEGVFSSKSDVYSFGVLLLEIVSGSKISSMHLKADFPNIIAYAWSLWKDGTTKDFVDSSIVESYSLNETSRCIHIRLLCVQNSPHARPLMSSIVSFLENGDISLPHPKQPIYFAEENYETDGAAQDTVNSANNMSITVLEGR